MGVCTVYVSHKSGSAASGIRVGGSVSMGGMLNPSHTGSNGRAILEWGSNASLSNIYVNGKGHKGPFQSGGTYTFQL